jgi:hypothetical protein
LAWIDENIRKSTEVYVELIIFPSNRKDVQRDVVSTGQERVVLIMEKIPDVFSFDIVEKRESLVSPLMRCFSDIDWHADEILWNWTRNPRTTGRTVNETSTLQS